MFALHQLQLRWNRLVPGSRVVRRFSRRGELDRPGRTRRSAGRRRLSGPPGRRIDGVPGPDHVVVHTNLERLKSGIGENDVRDRALAAELPLSRYTESKPDADKWRKHEAEIESVLPGLRDTIARSDAFAAR